MSSLSYYYTKIHPNSFIRCIFIFNSFFISLFLLGFLDHPKHGNLASAYNKIAYTISEVHVA